MNNQEIINHIESEITLNSNAYPETSLDGFAEACYDQNSESELAEGIIFYDQTGSGDIADMKTWGLSGAEWKTAIESALAELIRDRV